MNIYIGADHRGYKLKEKIKKHLETTGVSVVDVGNNTLSMNDDYVDFASKAVVPISDGEKSKAIVICGSGIGVDITANKFNGIRCGLCTSEKQAEASRKDDDINVLALGADFTNYEIAKKIVNKFLETKFSGEKRFLRRIDKIIDIEKSISK